MKNSFSREALYSHASSGPSLAAYFEALDSSGELESALPEMALLHQMPHREEFHPEANTVWGHTLAALRASETTDPLSNLCVALHDIGKCAPEKDGSGRFTYRGHEDIGVAVLTRIQQRTGLFNTGELRTLFFCIENHMHSRSLMRQETPRAVVLRLRSSEDWPALVNVMRSDNACRLHLWQPGIFADMLAWVDVVYQEWSSGTAEWNASLPSPQRAAA